jgi:hypothetical protein
LFAGALVWRSEYAITYGWMHFILLARSLILFCFFSFLVLPGYWQKLAMRGLGMPLQFVVFVFFTMREMLLLPLEAM